MGNKPSRQRQEVIIFYNQVLLNIEPWSLNLSSAIHKVKKKITCNESRVARILLKLYEVNAVRE